MCTHFLAQSLLSIDSVQRDRNFCGQEHGLPIYLSAPWGSVIFRFLIPLKNGYLCKGEQRELLYCIMVVKMKGDVGLFSGVGRTGFSSG